MRAGLVSLFVLAVACGGGGKSGPDAVGGAGSSGANSANGGHVNGAGSAAGGKATQGGESNHAGSDAGGETSQAGSGGSNPGEGGAMSEGGAPASGCEGFDDAFDGTTLSGCWQRLNGSEQMPLIDIAVSGGALHLSANGNLNGVWYQGSTKTLVYKLVTETHFKVTTVVHPRKATSPNDLPTKDLHVGGLMLRSPASQGGSSENYLLFMAGHSENNNGVVHQGVELKSTVNGCSDWNEPDWGAGAMAEDAELRICRLGPAYHFYKRVPGAGQWTAAQPPTGCPGNNVYDAVFVREDLPETLQVGMALNFSAPSDLDVAFDAIELVPLPENANPTACTSD